MKKLLPFTLAMVGFMTACNSNLVGSGVFNKKMMKYNFGEQYVMKDFEQKLEEKVAVTFPEGESFNGAIRLANSRFVKITTNTGKIGIFSVFTGAPVIPFGEYDDSDFVYTNKNKNNVYYIGLVRTLESGDKEIDVYNQYGTKILTGEGTDFTIAIQREYSFYNRGKNDNRYCEHRVFTRDVQKLVTYNIDGSSSVEDFVELEYINDDKLLYSQIKGDKYGHKGIEVRSLSSSGGHLGTYDTNKHKFIASFNIDTGADKIFYFGDYIFTQRKFKVDPRGNKFDYSITDENYRVVTERVNYLTGKESTVKTNFLISDLQGGLYSDRGILEYYQANIQYFSKDGGLDQNKYSVILDSNLKVKADVTGMDLGNLISVGDYYFSDVTHIVYNEKGEEVLCLNTIYDHNRELGLLSYEAENGLLGVIDAQGREVLPAKFEKMDFRYGNSALARDEDNFYLYKFEQNKGKLEATVKLTFARSEYTIHEPHDKTWMNQADFYATNAEGRYHVDVKAGTATLEQEEASDQYLAPSYYSHYGSLGSVIQGFRKFGTEYKFVISSLKETIVIAF